MIIYARISIYTYNSLARHIEDIIIRIVVRPVTEVIYNRIIVCKYRNIHFLHTYIVLLYDFKLKSFYLSVNHFLSFTIN